MIIAHYKNVDTCLYSLKDNKNICKEKNEKNSTICYDAKRFCSF